MRKVVVLALMLAACTERPLLTARDMAPPPVPQAGPTQPTTGGLVVPDGYAAQPVANQLTDPRAVLFDPAGQPLVLEGSAARLSRVNPDGTLLPLAEGGGNGPWSGAAALGGRLFVAESGGPLGGRILEIGPSGALKPLAVTLPAGGLVGPLAAGPDGALYVAVASAAAAGGRADIACQDRAGKGGGTVEGAVPCTGAVLKVSPQGGPAEMHSWGWRTPVALAFAADGSLLVADRGAADSQVHQAMAGVWYGWPESQVASTEPADLPNPPPRPLAHVVGATGGLAATDRDAFGGPDEVFLTLTNPDGQGVVAFARRQGGTPVPFAANLRQPQALAFGPGGDSLWVADSGTGTLWRIRPLGQPARALLPEPPSSGTPVPRKGRVPAWKIRA